MQEPLVNVIIVQRQLMKISFQNTPGNVCQNPTDSQKFFYPALWTIVAIVNVKINPTDRSLNNLDNFSTYIYKVYM